MQEWWQAFSSRWSWSEPTNVVGVVTVAVTALIPVAIWWLARVQEQRDAQIQEYQAESLRTQERILRRQRRDSLVSMVRAADDATHLRLLWDEIQEFDERDKRLLLAYFRTNPSISLPGGRGEPRFREPLTESVVADYVAGLENRYGNGRPGYWPYEGLLEFIGAAKAARVAIDPDAIARLVTGPTAAGQMPSHAFYRDLVAALPEAAGPLVYKVRSDDKRMGNGIRRNILTGVLLAVIDAEFGRPNNSAGSGAYAPETLRDSMPMALASVLVDGTLQSLGRWDDDYATEPVSATVAWLIRVVGWLADANDHLAMRMIESLEPVISSIPPHKQKWGTDAEHVRQGLRWIEKKQPELWKQHGARLVAAAEEIGTFVTDED